MKTKTWQNPLHIVLCLCVLVASALAFQNVYDKFRDHNYSNQGYLSEPDEIKLAEQVHQQLLNPPQGQEQQTKPLRLVQGTALNDYVERLGQRLARDSRRPNLPWHFYVVDDKSVNAFATLGGRVYVHMGLLNNINSEAQLASVLGHEVGHIAARHGLENVKRAQKLGMWAAGATILGAILGGQQGAQTGQAIGGLLAGGFLMKHSREAEREADYLGLYNIERSGYNTGGMVEMFEILAEISKNNAGSLGNIMASHPPATERLENTRREIADHLRGSDQHGTQNTTDFQRVKGGASTNNDSDRTARPRSRPRPRP